MIEMYSRRIKEAITSSRYPSTPNTASGTKSKGDRQYNMTKRAGITILT
jgi:hypothetical protein